MFKFDKHQWTLVFLAFMVGSTTALMAQDIPNEIKHWLAGLNGGCVAVWGLLTKFYKVDFPKTQTLDLEDHQEPVPGLKIQ